MGRRHRHRHRCRMHVHLRSLSKMAGSGGRNGGKLEWREVTEIMAGRISELAGK